MTLQHADARIHAQSSEVPSSIPFPPGVRDFVESRGYDLCLLMRGDKVGLVNSKKGFYPLLISELPPAQLEDLRHEITQYGFRVDRDETIVLGDCQFYVRAKAAAERHAREAQARWDALNGVETIYNQVDEWNASFRDHNFHNTRVEATRVGPVTDHVDNNAERSLAAALEARLKGQE